MRWRILVLLVLLPTAALCRQTRAGLIGNDAGFAESAQQVPQATANDNSSSLDPPDTATLDSTLTQGSSAPASQGTQLPRPGPQGGTIDRSGKAGSMVGYIDNAIVESQIVVRAEDEIQNLTYDLAEFFIPQCKCGSPPGTGPPIDLTNLNAQILHLYGEYAVNRRFSVFTDVPVRWLQPVEPKSILFGNQAGLSDVMAGFKFALAASPQHYVTFEVQSFFPSGSPSKGLGTGHYSVQPSILYYQRVTNRLTLESEFGGDHPIGGTDFAGDVLNYGIGPSYKLYASDRFEFAPLVEFIGWRILNGQVTNGTPSECTNSLETNPTCSAAGINILNLKGGARVTVGAHNSVYVGYGRALTGAYWYLRVMRVEYRYTF
jgi:hypothetical protein